MSMILVERDGGKNRVAKEVTSAQRTEIMKTARIWDLNADGTIAAGPLGPTEPLPTPTPAAGVTNTPEQITPASVSTALANAAAPERAANWAAVKPANGVARSDLSQEVLGQLDASVAWIYPGIGPKFDAAVEGLPKVEDIVFGTATPIGNTPVSEAIRDLAALSAKFRPLEGEFDANGTWIGGTGLTTINSEPQRYTTAIGAQGTMPACHIMDADGLRLQAVVQSGTFNTYLLGQVLTSGGGVNVNSPGGTTPTAVADCGITSGDLANIGIGDVVMGPNNGMCRVIAKDGGAGTLTLESVSNGIKVAYKGNWAMRFTKFAFAEVAANVVPAVTAVLPLKDPVPANIVPGNFVMGVRRSSPFATGVTFSSTAVGAGVTVSGTAGSANVFTVGARFYLTDGGVAVITAYTAGATVATVTIETALTKTSYTAAEAQYSYCFFDPVSSDRARIQSISPDRLTVTLDGPMAGTALSAQAREGVLFIPELWSGQIWSKRNYGPHLTGKRAVAVRVKFVMPSMSSFGTALQGAGNWVKSAIEAAQAGAPNMLHGYWPAIWFFTWRGGPGGVGQTIIPGGRLPWCELDVLELFTHVNRGQNTWTGNLHDQPFTRRRSMTNSASTARNGGTWRASAATNKELTPNAADLVMPTPIASGTERSIEIIWTRDKVAHYLDGVAVCESDWSVDSDYPLQLGINVACGSLVASNAAANGFFPHTDAQANGQFLKIKSIETWEW